jgi:HD-GYP domain-containing protein (c-di-GMP phosphodiesterase class II)
MRVSPEIVRELVRAIEEKDLCTAAHTWRVVLYARALAEDHGVDPEMLERITHGAALHDLGKIDIPAEVLQKPGILTRDEFEVIKTHAALGHLRLIRLGVTDPVILDLVRHHHEQWDGKGYPDGLTRNEIPVAARYFAVVDSFDAMTTVRPYRAAVGEGAVLRALRELERGSGVRYCPAAVEAFVRLARTGSLDWIHEHFNDTCPVAYSGGEVGAVAAGRARPA